MSTPPPTIGLIRLRPRFGMALSISTAALGGFALVNFLVLGQPLGLLLHGWGIVLVVFVVWMLFWAPHVTIADHAVIIDNPARRVTIPWAAIERIDTRWSLRLFTGAGTFTAWSAPAPSRHAMMRVAGTELKGLPESTYGPGQSVGIGDIPESESGLAAYHVRRRWELLRDQGLLNASADVTSECLWARVAGLCLLVAATVAGFFLP